MTTDKIPTRAERDAELAALIERAQIAKRGVIDRAGAVGGGADGTTWRDAARAVLCAIDAVIPKDADRKTVEAVYSAVYPFRGGRENHPYKIWLSERKAFLLRRFGKLRTEGKSITSGLFQEAR